MKDQPRKLTVEIVQAQPSTLGQDARLEKLIEKKIAEMIGNAEDLRFEPWFRTKRLAYEIKRLQTVPEQRRWTAYFERHGCIRCNEKTLLHAGNGFCARCRQMVVQRLAAIERGLMAGKGHEREKA